MDAGETIVVKGDLIDEQTRCVHYNSALDIIAIKFKCCDTYYSCAHCHEKYATHAAEVWKKEEREERAVLCGNCRYELGINEYFGCGYRCPNCRADFNPKCKGHEGLYFE